MNGPSLDVFEENVQKDGLIIVNTSMVSRKVMRKDVQVLYIPLSKIAVNLGLLASANMVLLGAYLAYTGIIDVQELIRSIPIALKKKQLIDINIKAVEAGIQYITENYSSEF